MKRIYLDYGATAPLAPEAREAMLPWLDSGNPSSLYEEGRRAKSAIDEARERLAAAFGSLFAEVIFTSGGTESANLAILGTALANADSRRKRVLMGAGEHHCVLHTTLLLQRLGYVVDVVAVDRQAKVDYQDLKRKLGDDVLLVAIMHANNELGTLNELETIGSAARALGTLLFADAVQTFGNAELSPRMADLPVDLVSISSHKLGGPKGAGALFVRAGTRLAPLSLGGGQERELRAGTENVAAIVGFAAAVEVSRRHRHDPTARDAFEQVLIRAGALPSVTSAHRTAGHCHVRFPGVDAETLLIRLDREGIAASSGAACSSGSIEPSHVLLACGYSAAEARQGVRFTLGPQLSLSEAEGAGKAVAQVAGSLVRS